MIHTFREWLHKDLHVGVERWQSYAAYVLGFVLGYVAGSRYTYRGVHRADT